ncbi:ryanodine receptor 3-like [Spea bombifrons]|uniref:ryanodine receptor 3-like n=1 Tax=Spea bombifrons TaxID=233779 RepID=UPI00234B530D|nr:ryanodine receptor 3-like [Spea bombifrons]
MTRRLRVQHCGLFLRLRDKWQKTRDLEGAFSASLAADYCAGLWDLVNSGSSSLFFFIAAVTLASINHKSGSAIAAASRHCTLTLVSPQVSDCYHHKEDEEEEDTSWTGRLRTLVYKIKGRSKTEEQDPAEEEEKSPTTLKELISQTMVRRAQEDHIQDPELVRIMFSLLRRQYDSIGELLRAMRKTYTIGAASVEDTIHLLASLGQIRSLLSVRMGKEEEMLMIDGLDDIMNNKVFYQHPNLMRVLGMHETVMEVMVNVLGGDKSQAVEIAKEQEDNLKAESEKADMEDGEKKNKAKAEEESEFLESKQGQIKKRRRGQKKEEPEALMANVLAGLEIFQTKMLNYLGWNFYNLRYLALFVAFAINFILLFYKVKHSLEYGLFNVSLVVGQSVRNLLAKSQTTTRRCEEEEDADEGTVYFVLQENTGYMAPTLRILAIIHNVMWFLCVIGYYCLKVPLVGLKREKEIARNVEFDGLYITEQPSDDDIKGQWERLVINTPSFPNTDWDKFVKRKVSNVTVHICLRFTSLAVRLVVKAISI